MNRNESRSAVFDCMIYLQAVINEKSPAAELFRQVEKENVLLFVSDEILAEVRDVLTRPKILAKNPHLTVEFVEMFLNRVLNRAKLLGKIPTHFEYSRDPKDEKYINLTVEAKAVFLVSRDNDLLDLMTDIQMRQRTFAAAIAKSKSSIPSNFCRSLKEICPKNHEFFHSNQQSNFKVHKNLLKIFLQKRQRLCPGVFGGFGVVAFGISVVKESMCRAFIDFVFVTLFQFFHRRVNFRHF